MKIFNIILFFFLFYVQIAESQTLISSDFNKPAQISLENNGGLLVYRNGSFNEIQIPALARNHPGKSFYFIYTNNLSTDFFLDLTFPNETHAGIAIYKRDNGELKEKAINQNKGKTLQLFVPKGTFQNGESILVRFWVIDGIDEGSVLVSTRESNSVRGIGTPPVINTTSFTPEELVTEILTTGCVQALNVQYTGNPNSIAYFSSGTPALDFEEGIILTSGNAHDMDGPNVSNNTSGNMGTPGDNDLNNVINSQTRDAAVLEFDFIPASDHVEFQYVFGSEEYEEYVGSNFNDVFAFFVSGGPENYNNQNIALIPGTSTPVSINNVNQNVNSDYYINNDNGAYLEFDGFTVTLTAELDVTPCETYHMKLAVADVSDRIYDSGVFLKAGSFISGTSVVMKNFNAWGYLNSIHEGCTNQLVFSRSDMQNITESMDVDITISGSATMGTDYTTINQHYIIPAGEEFITIDYDAIADNFADDNEYIVISIYNGCPCSVQISTDSIRIDDQIVFTPSFTTNSPVCRGDTAVITLNYTPEPDTSLIQWSTGQENVRQISFIPTSNTTVSVTIDYPCGTKTLSTSIVIVENPVPVASNTGPYCAGDNIELHVTPSQYYRWKGPLGYISTTQNPVISNAQVTNSGNYNVTVTNNNGCTGVTSTNVIVNPNPVPVISPPFTFCEGDSMTLSTGNYAEYIWSGPNGFNSNLPAPVIDPVSTQNSGIYSVTVVDNNSCRGIASADFVINPTPDASATSAPGICEGADIELFATGDGNYSWQGPDGFVSSEQNPVITNCSSIHSGEYTLVVESNSCVDSSSIFVQVDTIPDASVLPAGPFCSTANPYVLSANQPGGNWSGPGIVNSSSGLFNPSIAGAGLHYIIYTVTNGYCSSSDSIDIQIDELISAQIINPGSFCISDMPIYFQSINTGGTWNVSGITNSATGLFDPSVAGSGSHWIYYQVNNGVCNDQDSVLVVVYNIVDASITPVTEVCQNEPPFNLSAVSAGGIWTGNGITNPTNGTFSPELAGAGDHWVYYSVGNVSCFDSDSLLIHVDAVPIVSVTPSGPFCINDFPVALFATLPGGVWSGNGIVNSATGLFNPAVAGYGNHTIIYSITNGTCVSEPTILIHVDTIPDATITQPGNLCENHAALNLTATSQGGLWSGTGITNSALGTFNPQVAGPGNHQITYQVYSGACSDIDHITIHIDAIPDPYVNPAGPYCISDSPIILGALTPGGVWSGTGITNSVTGQFSPSVAGAGNHQITYLVTNGACQNSYSRTITVFASVDAAITPAGPYCQTQSPVTLHAVSSGGLWSGVGITNSSTGIFNPAIAGQGNHVITYSVQNGSCSDTETTTIHVDSYPVIALTSVSALCITGPNITLSFTPSGGTWSGIGITNSVTGVFSPALAGAGNHVLTYTVVNGACTAQSSITVHVDASPNAAITPAGPYCQNNSQVTLSAATTGGIWSGVGGLSPSGVFNPAVAGCGDHTVTYTVTSGVCVSSDTEIIHVDCLPDATIAAVDPLCISASNITLTAATAGGIWSGSGIVNTTTGVFSPALAGSGNHIITYTIHNGACTAIDTQTIHVDATANATITPAGPFCISSTAVTLTAASTGGVWSGTGISGSTNGLFDPAIAGAGDHTITYTLVNGACSGSDTEVIHVDASIDATINPSGPYCSNTGNLTLTAVNSGGTWSGTGITNPATGQFNPSVAGPGNHIVTYNIVSGACTSSATNTIHVDASVDATITPVSPVCENATPFNLHAVSTGGVWNGTGIINQATGLFNPGVAGPGNFTITYNIVNGVCSDNDQIVITVDDFIQPIITPFTPLCQNSSPVTLTANPSGGTWSGSGVTGSTFNPVASGSGMHTITYILNSGVCIASAITIIQVDATVDATITAAGPFCLYDNPVNLHAISNGGIWSGTGITNTSTGLFNPAAAGIGNHSVTYAVTNGTCSDSDTETITVDNAINAEINNPGPICITDAAFNLSAANIGGVWAGNGITNTSTGLFDPIVAGAGAHNITYEISNGACLSVGTMIVYVYNTVVDATITPVATQCVNGASIDLNAVTEGGTWSGTGITNTSTGIFDPGISGPGTFTIQYNVGNIACFDSDNITITVEDTLSANISEAGPFCSSESEFVLNSATSGGLWSGTGITNVNNGNFNPGVAGAGNHTITYSITSGSCTNSDQIIIHIDGAVSAQITPAGPFCIDALPVTLNAASLGGTWSGTGITNSSTGSFNPGLAGAGDHIITYQVSNGVCNDSQSTTIHIDNNPDVSITPSGPYCSDNIPISLNAATPGGTWLGNGITDNIAGIFSPSVAGEGNHTITYSLTSGACSVSSQATIHVDGAVDATITPVGPFCETQGVVQLYAVSPGGVWSGNGIINSATGMFHPGVAGNGLHTITYSVTNGICNASESIQILVDDNPNSAIVTTGPFCADAAVQILSSVTPGGTWSGTGVTNASTGLFDPAVAGTGNHLITYTLGSGTCSSSSQITIHIDTPVDATITAAGPYCQTGTSVTLSAATSGGIWSGNGITNQVLGVFNTSSAGGGDHLITYLVTNGACTDTDTETIHVDSQEYPVITSATGYCVADAPIDLTASVPNGTWSGPGITNSATGTFNPAIAGVGNFTILYTLVSGACVAEDDAVLEVAEWPDATITPVGPLCETEDPVQLIAVTAGGLWSGTGITNQTEGVFNPAYAGDGIHQIVYTTENAYCTDSDTIWIEVFNYNSVNITNIGPFCQSAGTVTLSAIPSGGTWSGTGISNPVTGAFSVGGLLPGSYAITYTVINGVCIAEDTQDIVVDEMVDATISGPVTFCETDPQTQFTTVTTGGTWSGPGVVSTTNGTFNPSVAGVGVHSINYLVTNGSCNDSDTHTITVYDNPEPIISGPTSTCVNAGIIDFSVNLTGGTWSGIGITDVNNGIFDPLVAGTGTHQIAFTIDNFNCQAVTYHNITVNTATPLSFLITDTTFCIYETPVNITVNPAGGILSGAGISGTSFNPASAGPGPHVITYTFTNSYGCTSTITKVFTVYNTPNASFTGLEPDYCLTDNPSILTGNPAGGVFFGDGITAGIFNPYTAGSGIHEIQYIYIDSHLCSDTAQVSTTVYENPSVITDSLIEPSCFGSTDGGVYISVVSGDSPYAYLWNNPSHSSTQDLIGIQAGNYTVSITDSHGCSTMSSITLNQPAALSLSPIVITNVSCFGGENGSANVSVTGGTPPYEYLWNSPNGGTTEFVNTLPAGTWIVLVSDANGCQANTSVTISQPQNITMQVDEIENVLCFNGNNGSVSISVTGGSFPYTYQWDDPASSESQHVYNLPAGEYHVTITDANFCEFTQSISITQPDSIILIPQIQHVSCGNTPGSVNVNVTGGTTPYEYIWNTGSELPVISGLAAGTYTLSLTDAHSCTAEASYRIETTGTNQVNINQTASIHCFGDTTASLLGFMPEGAAPFEFQWSTGDSENEIANLGAGEYFLTITDSWGCTGESSRIVTQPEQLLYAVVTTPVLCYGQSTGTASLNISGGVPPYLAVWENGHVGFSITGLSAGSYTVSVSDSYNCQHIADFEISQPANPLSMVLNITPISCYQDEDGEINAVAQGGTPPYTYYWFAGNHFYNTSTIRFLPQGVYNITITDSHSCSIDSLLFLPQPRPLDASFTTHDPSCVGNYDGAIYVAVTGGTTPYVFETNGLTYEESPVDSLYQGTYSVVIRDAHDCTFELNGITLTDTYADCLIIPNAFTPNGDGVNDEWILGNIHLYPKAYYKIINRWGQVIYESMANESSWDGTCNSQPVPAGPYMYVINVQTQADPYIGIVTVVR